MGNDQGNDLEDQANPFDLHKDHFNELFKSENVNMNLSNDEEGDPFSDQENDDIDDLIGEPDDASNESDDLSGEPNDQAGSSEDMGSAEVFKNPWSMVEPADLDKAEEMFEG